MSTDPPTLRRSQPGPLVPITGHDPAVRLPTPLSSLVGREDEIAAVAALVRDPAIRMLTLTGAGGVGKTRLALRVAADVAASFPDGVVFVECAAIDRPELVAPAIARTVDIRRASAETASETLKNYWRARRSLLILDNFEQVVEAAPMMSELLRVCPHLTALVTSRAVLRVSGEQVMQVPPLPLPASREPGALPSLDALENVGAVRLFVERYRAVQPGFKLTPDNAPAVAEICTRLDGLPLAIELAAARGALFSPSMLLERLEPRLPLLTAGIRDMPGRQRTMRDAIAWSYDLLSPIEQAVFRRLATFVGGCTLDAAETICAFPEPDDNARDSQDRSSGDIVTILESLVSQSLIQVSPDAPRGGGEGATRLTMLETVREFAADALSAGGGGEAHRRHAAYYCRLATEAARTYWGDAPGDLRATLIPELGNLRAALIRSTERGDTDTALQLASAVFDPHWVFDPLWQTSDFARELRSWTRRALAMPGGSPHHRVVALVTAACLAEAHEDTDEARTLVQEAIALAREHDDGLGLATASFIRGRAAFRVGDLVVSRRYMTDALTGFRAHGAGGRAAWALCFLASLDSRDAIDEGGTEENLARAVGACEKALATFREAGYFPGIVRASHGLAYIAYKRRDGPLALALTQEVLAMDWSQGRLVNNYLNDIAEIMGRAGESEIAARLYGSADRERARHGEPMPPVYRSEVEGDRALVRQAMGDVGFEAAWNVGHAMPVDQAVADALGLTLPTEDTPGLSLTPREREILPLLAAGKTDREIGDALFLSHRTVENHVARLRAKLGVQTRAEAIEAARTRGLLPIDPRGNRVAGGGK